MKQIMTNSLMTNQTKVRAERVARETALLNAPAIIVGVVHQGVQWVMMAGAGRNLNFACVRDGNRKRLKNDPTLETPLSHPHVNVLICG